MLVTCLRKTSTAAMRSAIGRDRQKLRLAACCWCLGMILATRRMT
jgi:hypothetical protein